MFTSNFRALPVLLAAFVLIGASSAFAADAILDFGALANQIQPILSTAIQAAAGVGVLVLAATVCWKFFRRFIRG